MIRTPHTLPALLGTMLLAFVLVACGAAASGNGTASGTGRVQEPAATIAAPSTLQMPTAGAATTTADAAPAPTAVLVTKLNLNTATEEQLLNTIPGFSSRMVREFFEYRPYISIEQFRKEIGKYVSAEQVAAYEQYVYVPIDVDHADAATLQQLPGVDATIAEQLIAGRPYGSNQTFLTRLASLVPAADLQQAAAYLAAE